MLTKILTSSLLFLVAIGGFFVSIDVDESAKSKNIISGISIEVSQTYAATGTTNSDTKNKWLEESIQALNAGLGVLTVIVSPAIIFAGWLMSPDWTSGDLFGLREPMHNMWVIVSNIVYFIYAILLIIIALATILGKGENFNYKAMLPRLALGILMVPFTWWFVQWTISLATVVTASVINIPMDMITENNRYINGNYIPRYYYTTTTDDKSTTTDSSNGRCTGGDSNPAICTNIQAILSEGGGTYSTLMIYAYQIFRIQDYKNIEGELNAIKTGGQILNNILIGAIMLLVFGLLVMALIAMLLLRAIKLWMYAIFSPIFTLHFVAGKELFGKNTEGFDIKEFIGLCFIPAIVGLTLSFGLMIISVVHDPDAQYTRCESINITARDLENIPVGQGCRLISLFGNGNNTIIRGLWDDGTGKIWSVNVVKIAGLTYIYKGKGSGADDMRTGTNNITGGLSAAGGILGTIIIDIIALVFIWMAFMAAKGVSKVAETAFRPFEEMGSKVGKMAMSAPQYMPLPIPGGSIKGASKMADIALQIPEAKLNKRLESDPLYKKLKEQAGMGGDTADKSKYQQGVSNKSIDATQQAIKQMNAKTLEQSDMREILSKYPEQFKQMVNNSVLAPNIKSKLLELYGDGKDIKPETKLIIDALLTGASIDINTEVKARKYLDDQYERNKEGKGGNANGGTSGFTSTSTTDVDNKTVINVTMGSTTVQIKDNKLSDSSINEIKTLKNKWTEEEFKKEIQNLPPGVRTLIEDTIKNIPDFYKVPPKV